jgi:hypothetical protein
VLEEKQNQVVPEENRVEHTQVSLIFDETKIMLGFNTTKEVRTNSLTKWKVLGDADNPWPLFLKQIYHRGNNKWLDQEIIFEDGDSSCSF